MEIPLVRANAPVAPARGSAVKAIGAAGGGKPKLSFFGHLALLARLLGRPRPVTGIRRARLSPWRFRRDLRRRGAGVVRIPRRETERLRDLAAQHFEAESADFARAEALNGAFPRSMSWHWATPEALRAFAGAARPVLRRLSDWGDEGAWRLVAASFVVAEGDCEEDAAKFHVDFGPPRIPRGAAATALLPLHPGVFPLEGNLAPGPVAHFQAKLRMSTRQTTSFLRIAIWCAERGPT